MAGWYLILLAFWMMTATLVFAFVVCVVVVKPWNVEKVAFLAALALLIYYSARPALSYRRRVRNFRINFLALDHRGVRFRLTGVPQVHLDWGEITGVTYQKRSVTSNALMSYRVDTYTLVTPRGSFPFSAFDIPRPAQAAHEIANRAGVEIHME